MSLTAGANISQSCTRKGLHLSLQGLAVATFRSRLWGCQVHWLCVGEKGFPPLHNWNKSKSVIPWVTFSWKHGLGMGPEGSDAPPWLSCSQQYHHSAVAVTDL